MPGLKKERSASSTSKRLSRYSLFQLIPSTQPSARVGDWVGGGSALHEGDTIACAIGAPQVPQKVACTTSSGAGAASYSVNSACSVNGCCKT